MRIAYVLKTFPKLSETFILNEILELERQGVQIHIYSLREPSGEIHGAAAEVRAGVTYMPLLGPVFGESRRNPPAVLARLARLVGDHVFVFLRRPRRYVEALSFHVRRGGRKRHFIQAGHLARYLIDGAFTHVHAHFANEPTTVTELANHMTGFPYSFTAHAKDIYLSDRDELARKIAAAKFVITCTGFNKRYLEAFAPAGTPIHLCYHGVDLSRFAASPWLIPDETQPPVILSVGRFCEKKGFPYLLEACSRLKQRGRRFVCRIVGFGPLEEELRRLIQTLDIADCVSLVGKMKQERLIEEYRTAGVFVLPCVVADDGDRDGIPNVLVEAMAMRLPVVSTPVSGITELVQHMEDGVLAAERDAADLANAIETLLGNPELRRRLGSSGAAKVIERFSLDRSTARVRELLLRASSAVKNQMPLSPSEVSRNESHVLLPARAGHRSPRPEQGDRALAG